jgi:hypothetical protein
VILVKCGCVGGSESSPKGVSRIKREFYVCMYKYVYICCLVSIVQDFIFYIVKHVQNRLQPIYDKT